MKKDQELSMLIGKRMTNGDTMFNEYLYEVLNAAQESGKRMGYAQGRDETAREILQELKKEGIMYSHFGFNEDLVISMEKLNEIAKKYGIELED